MSIKEEASAFVQRNFTFLLEHYPWIALCIIIKKKRCVRNTEFNLNRREKVLTRVVKLYSPFTEASKKNFFHRSAILSKIRILQDGREKMR